MNNKLISQATIIQLENQGNNLFRAGRYQEAKHHYLEIIKNRPNNHTALHGLGMVEFQGKNANAAIEYFLKAIKSNPKHKGSLLSLANIYSQLSQFLKAVKIYKKYLKIDNQNPAVYFHLACNYMEIDEDENVVKYLDKSIKLNPNEEAAYIKLADQYSKTKDFTKAKDIYALAFKKGLKSRHLYECLANSYVVLGELAQAKEAYKAGIAEYADHLSFVNQLSRIDDECINGDLQISLDKGLATGGLIAGNEMLANFLLAKCAKKEGRFHQEMQLNVDAHRIYRTKIKGSYHHDARFYLEGLPVVAATEKRFSADKGAKNKLASASPIFIVGVPRCGSTLVENVICASGDEVILKGEENGCLLHAFASSEFSNTEQFWEQFTVKLAANYTNSKLLKENGRFTDKVLENLFFVDVILSVFPKAKIIYCQREPLASIVSILQNNLSRLPWAHDVDEIFQYIKSNLQTIDMWREKYSDNIYTVVYEQFVSDPVNQSKKLLGFCDLQWTEDCLNFYNNKGVVSSTASNVQIRKKMNTNASHKYKNYLKFFDDYLKKYQLKVD